MSKSFCWRAANGKTSAGVKASASAGAALAKACLLTLAALCMAIPLFLCSCSQKAEVTRLVLWVSDKEFARYVELFNSTHKNIKVILVYKENPAAAIPPQHDELQPDIISGAWLRTERTAKNFKSLGKFFDEEFPESAFYSQLLEAGKVGQKQYLLPLSFNLPAIIFSQENSARLSDSYTITIEQIRQANREFNEKNENSTQFSKIGFTLLDNSEFLCLTTKIMDADFHKTKTSVTWNDDLLFDCISYLRNWLVIENGGASVESDFAYKYLSMPSYRKVGTDRCLFAYIKSDDLFSLSSEQTSNLDYRWISDDGKLPLEDSLCMIGISTKSKHTAEAKIFLKWLLSVETQRNILDIKSVSHFDTDTFGIAGGFSSLQEVNEQILPAHYTMLMSNIPQPESLQIPAELPPLWNTIKERVITPYLLQACSTATYDSITPLEERLIIWERQNFN